jgi:P4 family phage/plasmid primase-like protien
VSKSTPVTGSEDGPQIAERLCGAHLAVLLDADPTDPLSSIIGDERARIVIDWQRQQLYYGRMPVDAFTGKPELDPWIEDVPVIPVEVIADVLDDHGVAVPTRQAARDFAQSDVYGASDPEIELMRARLVFDPDLNAMSSAEEPRVCGVPKTVYDALGLDPDTGSDAQAKVLAGSVIAPPQSPTAVAHYLARHEYSHRWPLPTADGSRPRRKAWMRTLLRIDQTWYSYERTAPDDPPRWIAKTDPEWMRGQLREALGRLWYVKIRKLKTGDEYELKWWNPDDRGLTQVENALADLLNAGTGTQAREIPDVYRQLCGVYSGDTRVLVRDGVLDIETGRVALNTPLWFSLSRIEADYDHGLDPYADCEWLRRALGDQWADDPGAIACLQQFFGYVLSGRTDLQKWMLLLGPTGSAKSIIAAVLGALVGVVSATKLDTLNSQFGLQNLYETGAQLAVMSDIRFGARDSSTAVGNLLAVTGEDVVIVERKYKTAVPARLPVRFLAVANEMPRWSDNSSALEKRALILRTTRAYRGTDCDDPGLKDRIITGELGQVLRWAVEGLALLNASGGQFTLSVHAAADAEELAELSSAVRTFVNECCVIGDENDYVDLQQLFKVWQAWTEATNTGRGMSRNKFREALKSLYLDPVKPGQKRMPDDTPGKWLVVWGIKYAEATVTDPRQFGSTVTRTVSTDKGVTNPWRGKGNYN